MRSQVIRRVVSAITLLGAVLSFGGVARADPDGWTCPQGWYGTNDGCDCGCGRLDLDCDSAKASACQYWTYGCGSQGAVVRSQNWRCAGQPLSGQKPGDAVPTIPSTWLGTAQEFLDNECSCGLGAFDYACDGPGYASCETNACEMNMCAAPSPSPRNNWSCDSWRNFPETFRAGDGCDCGYGEPDPDCPNGLASSCNSVDPACSSSVAPNHNWVCGAYDAAEVVPATSYCSDTVNWTPEYARLEELFVRRVNEYRAQGGTCGARGYFPPAQPLAADPNLRCAARKYSKAYTCSHTDNSGGAPWDRAASAGYDAQCLGEALICARPMDETGVDTWMLSDGHCETLMLPYINEVGVGISTYAVLMTGRRVNR